MGFKRKIINTQAPKQDESGKYYIDTGLPHRSNSIIPIAYKDSTRVGWENIIVFKANVTYDNWRIYFNDIPSGDFGGVLYYFE